MTRTFAAAVAALLLLAAPAGAQTVSSQQAVDHLNAQRAANGIPGPLTRTDPLTVGCANHNAYMALNGGMAHGETAGNPGWTPEGAGQGEAGGSEVLSSATGAGSWDDAWRTPWDDAPIHQILMYSPSAAFAGYAESDQFSCMRFRSGSQPVGGTYTWPGKDTTDVPTETNSQGEGPYSPNDVAGLDDSTGLNLLVFRDDLQSASITRTGGAAVTTRFVDEDSTVPGGGTWIWGAGVVIPEQPLAPSTQYTAKVVFEDTTSYTWSFTTAGPVPDVFAYITSTDDVRWTVGVGGKQAGVATVEVFGPNGPVALDGQQSFVPATTGRYTICATAGGPGTGFSKRRNCASWPLEAPPAPVVPVLPVTTTTPPPAVPATPAVVRAKQALRGALAKGRLVLRFGPPTGAARTATVVFRNRKGKRVGKAKRVTARGVARVKAPRGWRSVKVTAPRTATQTRLALTVRR